MVNSPDIFQAYSDHVLSSYQAGKTLVFPHERVAGLWQEKIAQQFGVVRCDRIIGINELLKQSTAHLGSPATTLDRVVFLLAYAKTMEPVDYPINAWFVEYNQILPELEALAQSGDLAEYDAIYHAYAAYLTERELYEQEWVLARKELKLPNKPVVLYFPEAYHYEIPETAFAQRISIADFDPAASSIPKALSFEHAQAELAYAKTWIENKLELGEEVLVTLVSPDTWKAPLEDALGQNFDPEFGSFGYESPLGQLLYWFNQLHVSSWAREVIEEGAYHGKLPWKSNIARKISEASYASGFESRKHGNEDELMESIFGSITEDEGIAHSIYDYAAAILYAKSVEAGINYLLSFADDYMPSIREDIYIAKQKLEPLMASSLPEGLRWIDIWLLVVGIGGERSKAYADPQLKIMAYPESVGAPIKNHIVLGLDETKLKDRSKDILSPQLLSRMDRPYKALHSEALLPILLGLSSESQGLFSSVDFNKIATMPLGLKLEACASDLISYAIHEELTYFSMQGGAASPNAMDAYPKRSWRFAQGFWAAYEQVFSNTERLDFTTDFVPEVLHESFLAPLRSDKEDAFVLSASFLDSYVKSGFDYFLSRILGLPSRSRYDKASMIESRFAGSWAHALIEFAYNRNPAYRDAFENGLDIALAREIIMEHIIMQDMKKGELEDLQLLGLYKLDELIFASLQLAQGAFRALYYKHPDGRCYKSEYRFDRLLLREDLPRLRGSVDHIGIACQADGEESEILVYDFKRSTGKSAKTILDPEKLDGSQIPAYLAATLQSLRDVVADKLVGAYVELQNKKVTEIASGDKVSKLLTMLEDVLAVVQLGLLAGDFRSGTLDKSGQRNKIETDYNKEISRSGYHVRWKKVWE